MNKMDTFIERIISEASLDARITNGLVDLNNPEHIQVVAETMYDISESQDIVNEFLRSFVDEGKYPERQAYNREGWLVTFPSKEYRDAAIKKGTHSVSDPTHGKGGMNLYYKRKGKQKRQTQQSTSQADAEKKPIAKPQAAQPTTQPVVQPTTQPLTQPKKQKTEKPDTTPSSARAARLAKLTTPSATKKQDAAVSAQVTKMEPEKTATTDKPVTEPVDVTPAQAPAIEVPVVTVPTPQYSDISKKFAAKKGWIAEPYGEYRDAQGNTVAVVGLSGEIVPTRSNEREEYKLFAEKSMA